MEIKKIHHVAVIVSDYKVSRQFYTEVLGLKIVSENYRKERDSYKLDLEIPGGSQIELFSFPNPPKRLSYPEARGLRHIAFVVADIEKAVSDLEGRKIEVEPVRVDPITGKKFTFFKDPDDLPLELYEESELTN